MKFKNITKEEKVKEFDKMFNYVKKLSKNCEPTPEEEDNVLYNSCRTAGFMFYEFLSENLKE